MKCLILLLISTVMTVDALLTASAIENEFSKFRSTHSVRYRTTAEQTLRKNVFAKNLQAIADHNAKKGISYTLGVNEYSDLTSEEFAKKFLSGLRVPKLNSVSASALYANSSSKLKPSLAAPVSLDWRTKGAVTSVKNQGSCGCCWAFSATGSLEGRNFLKTGRLVSLSEQNLVDCTRIFNNYGCGGGWPANAFLYTVVNQGIDTSASYPYEARDYVCRFKRATVGATTYGWYTLSKTEVGLENYLATYGPISVCLDATTWGSYRSGVFDGPCGTTINHAVLIVGYGTDSVTKKNYWLIKNSWGTTWGEGGYMRIVRGKNMCNLVSYTSFPM